MDYQQTLTNVWQSTLKVWTPPPALTLSEWADQNAYLSPESAANPGRWRTLPYQKGIMDALTDTTVEYVTFMKSARVGYTKIINWLCGYHIHQDPCGVMVVQPTIEDAHGYSKDELAPMIRDTPVLTGLVSDPKSRDSNNTIMKKHFPGGQLLLTGANSARGFRRVSVRKVCFDEIDGYPPTAGLEGDQIKLGIRRTDYFWNRQIVLGSTPTIKGISRIEHYYELSDKRRYYVPCPHCGHMQYLKWAHLDFSNKGTVENPLYICEKCQEGIGYEHHRWMMERGEWRAEKPFKGHAGFHIWAAYSYSPNATWAHIVREFLESKDDREKLKTFVNTVLGETWVEEAEQLNNADLMAREEIYPADVADGVLLIIGSADVQDDRIECLAIGYGQGWESWIIEKVVFTGDTKQPHVWNDLTGYLDRQFKNKSGDVFTFAAFGIDTGYRFDMVAAWYHANRGRRIYLLKGSSVLTSPIVSKPRHLFDKKLLLYMVGPTASKDIIYARLQPDLKPGPGYIHFPAGRLDDEFYRQIASERVFVRMKNGIPYRQYDKVYGRNEALDLLIYGLVVAILLNPNFNSLARKQDSRHDHQDRDADDPAPGQPMNQMQVHTRPRRPRGGGFSNNW